MQEYLSKHQQQQLNNVLKKHQILFNGKLGHYPHQKFHLNLIDSYKLVYKNHYSILYKNEMLFQKELYSLIKDGVLEKCGASAWASPTFIVLKKEII